MSPADLVAVASIGSRLQILTDFTRRQGTRPCGAHGVLGGRRHGVRGRGREHGGDRRSGRRGRPTIRRPRTSSAQELDTFNNDVRLRALKTLAEALTPIQQKKAILYFSSGMQRNGTDNQVELRAAVNAAVRANVAIYPVDARGLQAIVPGGSARQGSRGGLGAFSGSGRREPVHQLAAQQETLTTLASDTGGTAFLDTNDFGEAFATGDEGHLVVLHPRVTRARTATRTADSAASPSGCGTSPV